MDIFLQNTWENSAGWCLKDGNVVGEIFFPYEGETSAGGWKEKMKVDFVVS